MICIIDYGMGNLHSVQNALEHLGLSSKISSSPEDLQAADRLILPGVGAFPDAMAALGRTGLDEEILRQCRAKKPLLGICLGMQLLFEQSSEGGLHEGLGLMPGEITRFEIREKVPHMGWNSVKNKDKAMFAGLPDEFSVYFVHSYCAQDVAMPYASGITQYGVPFVCAVHHENVYGCQFHPEKSGENGMQILRNFLAV